MAERLRSGLQVTATLSWVSKNKKKVGSQGNCSGEVITKEFLGEQPAPTVHEAHVLSVTGVVPDGVHPVRLRIHSTEILDLNSSADVSYLTKLYPQI